MPNVIETLSVLPYMKLADGQIGLQIPISFYILHTEDAKDGQERSADVELRILIY